MQINLYWCKIASDFCVCRQDLRLLHLAPWQTWGRSSLAVLHEICPACCWPAVSWLQRNRSAWAGSRNLCSDSQPCAQHSWFRMNGIFWSWLQCFEMWSWGRYNYSTTSLFLSAQWMGTSNNHVLLSSVFKRWLLWWASTETLHFNDVC